jgi:taurine dioxygenase
MALQVRPLTPIIGAVIEGIDLDAPPDDEQIHEVHAALMAHKVVFFRDQRLTPAQQSRLAGRFGRLRVAQKAAFDVSEEAPEVAVLLNDRERAPNVNHYHADGIFRRTPEFGAMLYAVETPAAGGDTIFVNMQAAYEALSPEMRAYLDGKAACNDFMKLHGSPAKARSWRGDNAQRMARMSEQNPPVVHPMVRTHPVTGCGSLWISESFTTHVVDVPAAESRGLLEMLFRHCALPEFQCRFRWQPGSLAFWDNRSTLHYAVADYWPRRRLMHRVTIETDDIGAPGVEGLGAP